MEKAPNGIEHHEQISNTWDKRYKSGSFQKRYILFKEKIVPLLEIDGHWLDAGCGSGFFSRLLAREGAKITGLDAAVGMINAAKTQAIDEGIHHQITYQQIDSIEHIPFEAEVFNGCICLSVLEYIENIDLCLDEMSRVTKPTGYVVLSVPHKYSLLRFVQKILVQLGASSKSGGLKYLSSSRFTTTQKEIVAKMQKRGFSHINTYGFDPIIPRSLQFLFKPSLIYVVFKKSL